MYPALAVWNALRGEDAGLQTLWVGGEGGMEADLVKREGIPFESIPAAGMHGVGLRALPGNALRLGRGLFAARRILRRFQPEALLFTGGYVAVPLALAARLPGLGFRRPQSALYVPDIEPGLALKTLAYFSDHIALTAPEGQAYFTHHSPAGRAPLSVTGYPVRQSLQPLPQQAARRQLGLEEGLPTLLVYGGSKGARSINRALLGVLGELLADLQVIHLSGQLDWAEVEAARQALAATDAPRAARYHAYPYLHEEMAAALSASDLVIARAGASTLGEFPLFGLPAILVPYPYAWRYQKVNADYLQQRGAAVMVRDADLPAQILPLVRRLMNNGSQRAAMQQAMRSLATPHAAAGIATILRSLAASPNGAKEA